MLFSFLIELLIGKENVKLLSGRARFIVGLADGVLIGAVIYLLMHLFILKW